MTSRRDCDRKYSYIIDSAGIHTDDPSGSSTSSIIQWSDHRYKIVHLDLAKLTIRSPVTVTIDKCNINNMEASCPYLYIDFSFVTNCNIECKYLRIENSQIGACIIYADQLLLRDFVKINLDGSKISAVALETMFDIKLRNDQSRGYDIIDTIFWKDHSNFDYSPIVRYVSAGEKDPKTQYWQSRTVRQFRRWIFYKTYCSTGDRVWNFVPKKQMETTHKKFTWNIHRKKIRVITE